MATALSEEQFRCSICLDIFKDPVSISCGHNFCLRCIKRFWDTRHKYECPLCKESFKARPELRINVVLRDITEGFKKSLRGKPNFKIQPRRRPILRRDSTWDDVPCDLCQDKTIVAVKSCLVCQKSYCEVHLTPHLRDQVMTKHPLTDPATFITSSLCKNHNQLLEMFCEREQTPVCSKCTEMDHKNHKIVSLEKETRRIKSQMRRLNAESEQLIHARLIKFDEIKSSVNLGKVNRDREIQKSVKVATMVIGTIESNQAALIKDIGEKQEAVERKAEVMLKELEKEINDLQIRRTELQQLEHNEEPLHLIQCYSSLGNPGTRDWSKVKIPSEDFMGIVRTAFSGLVTVCKDLEKQMAAEEANQLHLYAVDVTLDPDTASGWVMLAADRKQVSLSCQRVSVPDNPLRFDSCVSVLGTQSFKSGRSYWVVQVKDKTDWDLGVAKKSINRKGAITVRPDSGYWAICRRKGGSLSACAGPSVTLHLEETPQKVGVFLDYEAGLVSFYDAEAKTHIYTYSGCAFGEPLYPYLNPCLHDNGKNVAPLIICPVESGVPAML
ncbi:E3 ubiquitin-protein ligase TRIM21-like [Notolabrus celidotus]|uniref:E3 ubiquitin-protein ligase TRIM21-like n=1 Tax=Notolabrus celidotus TaxID=1203425 RepID=UPI00149072C7|nr:E3 ubiquitin-protein ligase TRIM21-like [Notolabrus celidotus]